MTDNNHHLVIGMLTFAGYIKVMRKYIGFYGTYSIAFKDFQHWMHYQMPDWHPYT